MKSSLEKSEGPEGLVFHLRRARELSRIALAAAVPVAFFALFWRGITVRLDQGLVACVVLFSVASAIVSLWRGANVKLCVTNLDVVSTGHAPRGYTPSVISRADIYDLQYREAQDGGGEFPSSPEGLYVEYSRILPGAASACILPDVGREQTEEIIQRILERFPDTGKLASRPSEPSRLISLNLSGHNDR